MGTRKIGVILFALLAVNLVKPQFSFADGGYFTTYSHHIEKGELVFMLMNDFTSPSDAKREEGQENYLSHMLEIEYAPTNQLALEWMTEWFEETGGDEAKFTGFRYEARYRLFEKEVPLNPVLYVEYEDLDPATRYKMEVSGWVTPPYEEEEAEEPDRERIIETRVILSQDFSERWNAAFNWINETDTDNGITAFGYATGVSYRLYSQEHEHAHHFRETAEKPAFIMPAGLAVEFIGALGDSKKLDFSPSRQEHYIQPSIMFHVGERAMLSAGFAIGLTRSSDDLVRLNFHVEF
ncbi:MAG: hypothetical protein HYS08_03975 [Chlamydiae bacterium]|nr:hypothetical protein [Chlamydiota bacterium]MBI3266816.1 hypothetical protein [Chlamydiota bacterium]